MGSLLATTEHEDASENTLCAVELASSTENTASSKLGLDLTCSPCELPCCSGPEKGKRMDLSVQSCVCRTAPELTSTLLLYKRVPIFLAHLQGTFRGK